MLKYLFYIILLSLSTYMSAQETKVMEDLELWAGAKYKKKVLNKKLKLYTAGELRYRKNISELRLCYLEGGANYKITKTISVGGGLRYAYHRTWKGRSENLFRYHLDFSLQQKINRLSVGYRFRYQNTDDDFFKADSANNSIDIIRNKVAIKYNIKKSKLTPYFSAELFTIINNDPSQNFNIRYTLGTSIPMRKNGEIKVFYRLDQELNHTDPYKIYILGIRYVFS